MECVCYNNPVYLFLFSGDNSIFYNRILQKAGNEEVVI